MSACGREPFEAGGQCASTAAPSGSTTGMRTSAPHSTGAAVRASPRGGRTGRGLRCPRRRRARSQRAPC
eukprot:2455739-Prymnesium_polylepis.1